MGTKKAKYASISFEMDDSTMAFVKQFPQIMEGAKELAVESMGRVWSDGAKAITRSDHHIDTAAYINSIGYAGNDVGPNGSDVGTVIHNLLSEGSKTKLEIGSGVIYAKPLEKRFNIFARALDSELDGMEKQGQNTIKQYLKNRL